MNFLPEVCFVLLIHDCSWFEAQKAQLKLNWEYVSRSEMLHTHGVTIRDFDLENVEDQFLKDIGEQTPHALAALAGSWSAGGLASLWLGVDAVRKHLDSTKQRPRTDAGLEFRA
jgi:hypothetical protein